MRVLASALLTAACLVATASAVPQASDLTSLDVLANATDAEIDAYFKLGTPVVPGHEALYSTPGQPLWDFCVGRSYINAFTSEKASIVRGGWPSGAAHPLNNMFSRLWWGKIFYNDGTDRNVTQLWNLFFSNSTVDFDAVAYVNNTQGLNNDGDSVIVDYADSNQVIFREVIDEVRLVNAEHNIWVGHIWMRDPINSLKKRAFYSKADEVVSKASLAAVNSTFLKFLNWGGVTTQAGKPGDYFPLGWFGMQCHGPHTPHLKYTALSYMWELLNVDKGLSAPDYRLPKLDNPTNAPRPGPGFPHSSHEENGTFPKFHVWPFKPSDVSGIGNFTAAPYKKEIIVGNTALYPIAAAGTAKWRADGEPGAAWKPDGDDLAAADALAKLKVTAGMLGAEGKDLTVSPRVKGNVGPLDLTAWALDAIQAANDAAKDALAHPSPKSSWMAKEMAKAKLHGKIAVSLARDKFNLDAALATLAPVRHNATVASVAALLHDVKHANRTELPPKPSLADVEFDKMEVLDAIKHLNTTRHNASRVDKKDNLKLKLQQLEHILTPDKLAERAPPQWPSNAPRPQA